MELLTTVNKLPHLITSILFIHHVDHCFLQHFVSVLVQVETEIVHYFVCNLSLCEGFVFKISWVFFFQSQEHSWYISVGVKIASKGIVLSFFKDWVLVEFFDVRPSHRLIFGKNKSLLVWGSFHLSEVSVLFHSFKLLIINQLNEEWLNKSQRNALESLWYSLMALETIQTSRAKRGKLLCKRPKLLY